MVRQGAIHPTIIPAKNLKYCKLSVGVFTVSLCISCVPLVKKCIFTENVFLCPIVLTSQAIQFLSFWRMPF